MTAVQPPPISGEVDLTDFPFMPLDVRQLRDSRFASLADGEAFRCGVLLWCAAWHQLPAGSLPDDDVELANLAGFGRAVKEWKRVRDGALYGWEKCSDGRLYHRVVVEAAKNAWRSKLEQAYRRECDRLRKENKRRADNGEPKLPIPSFEDWNAHRVPAESVTGSGGIPPDVQRNAKAGPPDSVLKGEGRDRDRDREREGKDLASLGARAIRPPDVPRETDWESWESSRQWVLDTLRPVYPTNQGTDSDWEIAARVIAGRIEAGEVTRETLLQLTRDFAAQQDAKGNRNTQFVENPARHFDGRGRWRGPFPLPAAPTRTTAQPTALRPRLRTAAEIEAEEQARA